MPKKKPKLYAKYPPNVRRMLMRRDAEICRLTEGQRDAWQAYDNMRADRDRLAFSLSSLGNMVSTHPAPQAGAVVVKDAASPLQLGAGYWDDWEGDRFDQRTYDPPPYEDTLPAMPAMTLGVPTLNTSPWWRLAFWWCRHNPVTCPAVGDSLEGLTVTRSSPLGDGCPRESTTACEIEFNKRWWGIAARLRLPPKPHTDLFDYCDFPLPPATWRAA